MAKYEGQDHYLDPETGMLKNKLGIVDEDELNKAEASLVAWRSFQLAQNPIQGHFDLDHLKAIHKHLFGDVLSAARPLAARGLWLQSAIMVSWPTCPYLPTRTCCAMPVALPWPTRARTRGSFRTI